MNSKEQKQLEITKEFLLGISDKLIEDFKGIIAGNYGLYEDIPLKDVKLLDFEIGGEYYSLYLQPVDENNTQLGFYKLLPEYEYGILSGEGLILQGSDYDLDNPEDDKNFTSFYEELDKFFIEWVVECFHKAGGKNILKPAFLNIHDSNDSFDLIQERWVDDDEKWN
jgi:hypothetical protein